VKTINRNWKDLNRLINGGKKMRIFVSALILIGTGLLLLSGCGDDETGPVVIVLGDQLFGIAIADNDGPDKNGANLLTLDFGGTPDATHIVPANGTPVLDGVDEGSPWGTASTVSLAPINSGGGPSSATLKAAYDDTYLYFLVQWTDPTGTNSVNKKMWTYDSTGGGDWSQDGDEDRVYFFWDINSSDFASGGCAVFCHIDGMRTNAPGETIDEWHWKATRGNPVGYADDKWVDDTIDTLDIEAGHHGDNGTSTYSDNKTSGEPTFMAANGEPGANAVHLYQSGTNFDPYNVISTSSDSTAPIDTTLGWQNGNTLPGYILRNPAGSRANVQTAGKYSGGVWTVEFRRLLDTSNSDDALFN
jgi:hypothetical protein